MKMTETIIRSEKIIFNGKSEYRPHLNDFRTQVEIRYLNYARPHRTFNLGLYNCSCQAKSTAKLEDCLFRLS